MLHCDEETLALVAFGEPLDDDDRNHLKHCLRCRTELDQFQSVVTTGRSITAEDIPAQPPAGLWEGIAGELGLGAEVTPFIPDPADSARRAEVVQLAQYRRQERGLRRRSTWLAVAASVVGIAIGAIGATALSGSNDPGTVVAESQLATVPVSAGGSADITGDMSGTARIYDTDGQDYVEVDARGLPEIDGYYEVWLIKGDLSGMISLGALTAGSQGRFTIPPGTDLQQFTIIDVSVEPLNGDPTHSKESVLRGSLQV
jgi:anti-sigma-K factor RskA